MADQRFDWMSRDAGMAKTSRWNTAAAGAVPRDAWYYGPRLGRTELTAELLEELRIALWGARKERVIPGIDAKLDDALAIGGVPLLRITMPGRFVPDFDADGTTFYLYKASSFQTVIDFGRAWGGPQAVAPFRVSPPTIMGDVRGAVDPTDMPSPRGVFRADEARAEAGRLDPITTEVEPIPERPALRIVERSREPRVHHAVRPANPTCVPEADAVPDTPDSRAVASALKLFDANDDADADVPPVSSPADVSDVRSASVPPPVDSRHLALTVLTTACGVVAIVAIVLIVLSFA